MEKECWDQIKYSQRDVEHTNTRRLQTQKDRHPSYPNARPKTQRLISHYIVRQDHGTNEPGVGRKIPADWNRHSGASFIVVVLIVSLYDVGNLMWMVLLALVIVILPATTTYQYKPR